MIYEDIMNEVWTHGLVDAFAEDGEHEDGGDGRREIAGDGLDVVEELAALGRLHDGDPGDAHSDQEQDEHSAPKQETGTWSTWGTCEFSHDQTLASYLPAIMSSLSLALRRILV